MTTQAIEAALVHAASPATVERARRLAYAVRLVRQGVPRREVSGMVRRTYSCSPVTAWRISHMAWDLAGEVQ